MPIPPPWPRRFRRTRSRRRRLREWYGRVRRRRRGDRKSTRLNSSHRCISYAVFCLKKKKRRRSAQCRNQKFGRGKRTGLEGIREMKTNEVAIYKLVWGPAAGNRKAAGIYIVYVRYM